VDTVSHKGMTERPEALDLTDEQLLARVSEARARVREAKRWHDAVITDAMVRGLHQSLIAERAGVSRRALFDISSREWDRRQAEEGVS
jgi:hypothetical protein